MRESQGSDEADEAEKVVLMKPTEVLPNRPQQTAEERIIECRQLLVVHGFMTQQESDNVSRRIRKWIRGNLESDIRS